MYDVHVSFAIKDDIQRGVYLHKYFWNDNAQVIDDRISEWIELHENGTFVESSRDYVQSLANMLVILYQSKDRIRNYNFLFFTTLINFYDFGTKEEAWMTLTHLKKDDFQVWMRGKKIVSLMDKIIKD
jgi:hypothetical protein